ncbi:MAG: exopolyphosphatase [Actinomycetota bacterium]|nr:exopolyphosphatase [Actinomycetota bacterium]
MAEPETVAAIDCGTNSVRLLVLEGTGRELDRRMKVTRLGEGVRRTGRLSDAAIRRTLGVLSEYRTVMDAYGVGPVAASATAAARDAANSSAFLAPATELVGAPLTVLTGSQEAALSFAGATAGLPRGEVLTVFDVGGGSTEMASGQPGRPPESVVSLPLGCVRLTEGLLRDDPPTGLQMDQARREATDLVGGAVAAHPELARSSGLIGLAGTVTTLAALVLGLDRYDRQRVHRSVLTLEQVREWTRRLASQPAAGRTGYGVMEPGRADVIVGGAIVVEAVMRATGSDRCTVSEADILDGLAATLLRVGNAAGGT